MFCCWKLSRFLNFTSQFFPSKILLFNENRITPQRLHEQSEKDFFILIIGKFIHNECHFQFRNEVWLYCDQLQWILRILICCRKNWKEICNVRKSGKNCITTVNNIVLERCCSVSKGEKMLLKYFATVHRQRSKIRARNLTENFLKHKP